MPRFVGEPVQAGGAPRFKGVPAQAEKQPASPVEQGMILPISRDASGNVSFDSNAGLLGTLKRAVTLPRDVMTGAIPLNNEAGRPTDEVIARSLEAATVMSPVNPAVRAGSGVVPGTKAMTRQTKPRVPTAEELIGAGTADFERMRSTGVAYDSNAVKSVAEALSQGLQQKGLHPKTAKKTHAILKELADPPQDSVVDINGLQAARQTFRDIAGNFNKPSDQKAAMEAISGLDDFIASPPRGGVVAGSADEVAQALKSGNANYAAGKRSGLVTGIEKAADLRAAAANSGQNTGNAIRQRVASALLQPKRIAGYNAQEKAALEGLVEGSKSANATRYVGNLLGGGGGMAQYIAAAMAGVGGAAATGNASGAAAAILPMAVGAGSKQASNFLTRKALRSADEMIRMRSPLYESMAANAPRVAMNPEQRAAIVRALLMQQAEMGQQ